MTMNIQIITSNKTIYMIHAIITIINLATVLQNTNILCHNLIMTMKTALSNYAKLKIKFINS